MESRRKDENWYNQTVSDLLKNADQLIKDQKFYEAIELIIQADLIVKNHLIKPEDIALQSQAIFTRLNILESLGYLSKSKDLEKLSLLAKAALFKQDSSQTQSPKAPLTNQMKNR